MSGPAEVEVVKQETAGPAEPTNAAIPPKQLSLYMALGAVKHRQANIPSSIGEIHALPSKRSAHPYR